MADPLTLGLTAASTMTSIFGGMAQSRGQAQQAQAQSEAYRYQAGVARINRDISRQNAIYARDVGERQAEKFGITSAQRMGAIRAGQGASGIDLRSGSAVDVRRSQKMVSDLDMAEIRRNAAKTAYDHEVQAVQYENQAGLFDMGAANALTAGSIAQQATFLGTATSVSDRWLRAAGTMGGGSLGRDTGPLIYGPGY